MKKYQRIIYLLLALLALISLTSCAPEEEPSDNLYFEGPNLSDILFNYYADHYTDTYTVQDGKVEIRAEYEFYSSWGCLSYYLAVENAIAKTVENLTIAEILAAPDETASSAEACFFEKYDWLKLKIRSLQFTQVMQIE